MVPKLQFRFWGTGHLPSVCAKDKSWHWSDTLLVFLHMSHPSTAPHRSGPMQAYTPQGRIGERFKAIQASSDFFLFPSGPPLVFAMFVHDGVSTYTLHIYTHIIYLYMYTHTHDHTCVNVPVRTFMAKTSVYPCVCQCMHTYTRI